MGVTDVQAVQNQVQKFWSPIFTPELRESNPLINLVDKKYDGEIKKAGDTVRVSQIVKVPAQRKTIGQPGYNTFESHALQTRYVDVKADQIITVATEIDDLAALQSQIGDKDSDIRQSLLKSAQEEISKFLYSLVAPSTSAPDHTFTDASISKTELSKYRKLAAQSHWANLPRFALLSPDYWDNVITDEKLTSGDFVNDKPMVAGQSGLTRYGWQMFEDDSLTGKYGLFFTPDFLHMVTQMVPEFKLSDLHGNKQHGYLLSVRLVCGAALGIQGDRKHIETAA